MYQLVLYACVRTSTIFLSMPPAALARFSDSFNVHVDQLAVDMLNVTRKEQQCCGVWLPVRVASWEATEIVASVRLITNEQLRSQNATTAATVRQEVGRVLVVEIAMVPSALFLRSVKLECLARGRYETTPLHRTALWSVGFFFSERCSNELPCIIFLQYIQLIWRDLNLWGQKCKANGVYDTVNHFACNFAKCSPMLKILSPAEWMINF